MCENAKRRAFAAYSARTAFRLARLVPYRAADPLRLSSTEAAGRGLPLSGFRAKEAGDEYARP